MIEQQVHMHLDEIASTQLCEVPEGEPWDIDTFLENTKVCVKCVSSVLKGNASSC